MTEVELGLRVIDCSTAAAAAVTVRAAELLVIPDRAAVMLVPPAATPFATPAATVASVEMEDFQVALAVKLLVLPSL